MFLTLCYVVVLCILGYFGLLSRIFQREVMRSIISEVHFTLHAWYSVLEDNLNRKRNVLGKLPDQNGRVAVVTGAGRGIGFEVTRILKNCGMTVVMAVRNADQVLQIADALKKENPNGNLDVMQLDVSSMKSVSNFVKKVKERYPKIDVLVNNAGVLFGAYKITEDGFESQLATNYLGHFYLTHLLLPCLRMEGGLEKAPRIVNVSSCAHFTGRINFDDINLKMQYSETAAYAQSKLAQVMFSCSLDRMFRQRHINVHCSSVHPGFVFTDMMKTNSSLDKVYRLLFKTPREGALGVVHACLETLPGGSYTSNCEAGRCSWYSRDPKKQDRLFKLTCDMLGIADFGVVQ